MSFKKILTFLLISFGNEVFLVDQNSNSEKAEHSAEVDGSDQNYLVNHQSLKSFSAKQIALRGFGGLTILGAMFGIIFGVYKLATKTQITPSKPLHLAKNIEAALKKYIVEQVEELRKGCDINMSDSPEKQANLIYNYLQGIGENSVEETLFHSIPIGAPKCVCHFGRNVQSPTCLLAELWNNLTKRQGDISDKLVKDKIAVLLALYEAKALYENYSNGGSVGLFQKRYSDFKTYSEEKMKQAIIQQARVLIRAINECQVEGGLSRGDRNYCFGLVVEFLLTDTDLSGVEKIKTSGCYYLGYEEELFKKSEAYKKSLSKYIEIATALGIKADLLTYVERPIRVYENISIEPTEGSPSMSYKVVCISRLLDKAI